MSLMYAQMGMKVLGAFGAMNDSKTDYKLRKMQQAYQKTMTALSAAQSANTLTSNETAVRDASTRALATLQLQSRTDSSSMEAGAAAAGVTGGSVAASLRGLSRSRLQAEEAVRKGTVAQGRVNTAARRGLALDVAYNRDTTVLQRPSTASALLGLGASLIDTFDQHQPTGQKTADAMAQWFK